MYAKMTKAPLNYIGCLSHLSSISRFGLPSSATLSNTIWRGFYCCGTAICADTACNSRRCHPIFDIDIAPNGRIFALNPRGDIRGDMAHYHWQKSRKTYTLSYTMIYGAQKIERYKYSVQKTRIEDLLAATSELETAARTGTAPTERILGWVQRG